MQGSSTLLRRSETLPTLAPAALKDSAAPARALARAESVHFPATPIIRLKGSLHRETVRFAWSRLDPQQGPPGE
jgi:hypothetical protein